MTIPLRLYVPVYSVTLLLSAFLLFLVQPMFGKMLLPLLGGSSSVWTTAMLFFQVLLLAGYAYAHGVARFLPVRTQAALHMALFGLFFLVLPLAIPDGWTPPEGGDPTLWQLGLMAVAVGGPFFVLSASAPLLQHWFAHTDHKEADNPYFLYAASNLGSVSALLAYPFFVEPALKISEQSAAWTWGYVALAALVLLSACAVWGRGGQSINKAVADSVGDGDADDAAIDWKRRILWLVLAFVPSSLMLGVTTFITTDLASAPLLWILPLALYVSTFIIAFARKPVVSHERAYYLQIILFIMLLSFFAIMVEMSKIVMIFGHLSLFFFTALMCHHELALARPRPRHLTQFYLIMSLGGALGGFFNAIVAPNLFLVPVEYAIVLALACFMRETNVPEKSFAAAWAGFRNILKAREEGFLYKSGIIPVAVIFVSAAASLYFDEARFLRLILLMVFLITLTMVMERRWLFGICAAMILAMHPPGYVWSGTMFDQIVHRDRNFFGIIRVADSEEKGIRLLLHGTTIHGTQALAAENKNLRLSYYAENSGITDAFALADAFPAGPQRVAVIGLGIGVSACFPRAERHFDFYEIDPAVIAVAENPRLFTYLSDCGSPYDIVLGDARIKMAQATDDSYDVIVIDAFSSDSIPAHLLTIEAFRLYREKLRPGGIITINISNRYMDLKPVIANAAAELGMSAFNKFSDEGEIEGLHYYQADFVVMTDDPGHAQTLPGKGWKPVAPAPHIRLWTDQYSNILSLLRAFQMPAAPEVAAKAKGRVIE